MEVKDSEAGEYVLISRNNWPSNHDMQKNSSKYLSEIDGYIESLQDTLWPLNKSIHDEPELAFKEYKTHDELTNFMRLQEGWVVTPHAYGIETAWRAIFDTGRDGPTVSFNAEMGMSTISTQLLHLTDVHD
jgi:hypothetical protein